LYEPDEGLILLNGVDIKQYDRRQYYKCFSVVFQDINIFAFTIAENVSLNTKDKIKREKVKECLRKVGISKKVDALDKGIDTSMLKVLDECGVELSGGENQKIALSRALYKNSPVIILDEPTAALDPISELDIYTNLDKFHIDCQVLSFAIKLFCSKMER